MIFYKQKGLKMFNRRARRAFAYVCLVSFLASFTGNIYSMYSMCDREDVVSRFKIEDPRERLPLRLENAVSLSAPKTIKDYIKVYTQAEAFRHILPQIMVLHGPNGTGKSTIPYMIARQTERKIVFIRSGFLGTSFKNSEIMALKDVTSTLEKEKCPCVVVFDEADTLTKKKNPEDDNEKDNSRLSTAIGGMLDKFETNNDILFVWTTNNIKDCIRKKIGDRTTYREDAIIKMSSPNIEARKKIIEYNIEELQKEVETESDYSSHRKKKKIKRKVKKGRFILKKEERNLAANKTEAFSIRMLNGMIKFAVRKAVLRNIEKRKKENGDSENTDEDEKIFVTKKDLEESIAATRKVYAEYNGPERMKKFFKFIRKNPAVSSFFISTFTTLLSFSLNYYFVSQPARAISMEGLTLARRSFHQAINAQAQQKEQHVESIDLSKQGLEQQAESIDLSKQGLELQDESVDLSKQGLKQQTIQHAESIDLNKKQFDENMKQTKEAASIAYWQSYANPAVASANVARGVYNGTKYVAYNVAYKGTMKVYNYIWS